MSEAYAPYVAIALMAAATYVTRALGFYLAARLPASGRGEAFFKAIPGSILMSLVAPVVVTGGPDAMLASSAAALAAWKTRNLAAAMAAGVLVALLARHAL